LIDRLCNTGGDRENPPSPLPSGVGKKRKKKKGKKEMRKRRKKEEKSKKGRTVK